MRDGARGRIKENKRGRKRERERGEFKRSSGKAIGIEVDKNAVELVKAS